MDKTKKDMTPHRIAAEKFIEGYDKDYRFDIKDLGDDGCKLTGTYAINQYRDDEIYIQVRSGQIYEQRLKAYNTYKKGKVLGIYDEQTGELNHPIKQEDENT